MPEWQWHHVLHAFLQYSQHVHTSGVATLSVGVAREAAWTAAGVKGEEGKSGGARFAGPADCRAGRGGKLGGGGRSKVK